MSGALTVSKNNWGAMSMVPSLGNLDAYISAANRMPMLTLEEEQRYARQWKEEQNMDAAGRLVLSHHRPPISGLWPAPCGSDPRGQCGPDEGRQAL